MALNYKSNTNNSPTTLEINKKILLLETIYWNKVAGNAKSSLIPYTRKYHKTYCNTNIILLYKSTVTNTNETLLYKLPSVSGNLGFVENVMWMSPIIR